ncbi:restriction endonuclease subunit S [Vibrio furnissii]|uniref:restriction endonuclease subunit S n=1 Tax=Vibrio furnissii TaxID=29494 RepID=UPI001E388480|nr:restriction endonuclease subunit S [Vibrio furnissii]UHJ60917.1 restriction endonuclease subunit S [Vibrio furnissii]
MGKYQAYPEYNHSGNEFVGVLPARWERCTVGSVSNVIDPQPDHRAPEICSDGEGFPYIGIRDVNRDGTLNFDTARPVKESAVIKQEKSFSIEPNDIIFCKVGTLGLPRKIVPHGRCALSATLVLIKTKPNFISQFLLYALDSCVVTSQTDYLATGSTRAALGIQQIRRFQIPKPTVAEQTQIANFLDHETAKIDTLIEKQQQLIKLLKEKRQAVIRHAVTKGLNLQASMKDSGVEWLGEVPEHWEVKRVRHAFEIDNNLRTPIDRQSRMDMIGEYRYYGPTGVLNHINRFNVEGKYFLLGEDGDHFLKFKEKSMTILVDGQFNVNNHAHLLKGKGTCSTEWGCLLFEHKDIFPWLIKQGVGRYKLQKTVLLDIPVVVPPEKEQLYILGEINKRKRTFDEIEDKANQSINMLKERRIALISAAVTGKIDVRNWQAPTSQNQAMEQTT